MGQAEELPAPCTVESILEVAAEKWPDRAAIDFYDAVHTFAGLHTLALRAAKGLQGLGVGPGVNVALQLPNSPHFLACFFGVLIAGGRVVNCSPLAGMRELEGQLGDSSAQVLVTGNWLSQYSRVRRLASTGALRAVVACSLEDFLPRERIQELGLPVLEREPAAAGEISFAALISHGVAVGRPARCALEDEVAVLQYTGGTTGEPKAAMLTHANFAAAMLSGEKVVVKRTEPVVKTLVTLPLHHIFGLGLVLRAIRGGSQLVLHIRFDAHSVLSDIEAKKINMIAAVPSMFARLAEHPGFASCDFSSVLGYGSAGAPLSANVRGLIEERIDLMLKDSYALTETTGVGTVPAPYLRGRPGLVGMPAPFVRIEVVDLETGLTLLPRGAIGELCFTGPHVMKGYWNRPEETAEVFRGGRFHTGDIGTVDLLGCVILTERKKDVIFTAGHKVFPRNVEGAIQEHPAVAEVAVVGVPHDTFGEVAKAFVVLKPGCEPFSLTQLCGFLARRIASYEIPVEMEFRAELPQTHVSKLSKRALLAPQSADSC